MAKYLNFYALTEGMRFQLTKVLRWLWHGLRHKLLIRLLAIVLVTFFSALTFHSVIAQTTSTPRPKVILISLDGATPDFVEQYLSEGVLSTQRGLGLLKNNGIYAERNITCSASLTAACHVAIGTGSTAARNDINTNFFHLVASPLNSGISGFAAPIGGYSTTGPTETNQPTAEPIWIRLLNQGKKVVAATFPGADGATIRVPGLNNSPTIQSASKRTVTYTVPFGAATGPLAKGFSLKTSDFSSASSTIVSQLNAAGKTSYSSVLQASLNDQFTVGGVSYNIQVAALDTTNDSKTNYDTLVFFDSSIGIQSGPFSLPSTGPAYVKAQDRKSSLFYLEGSSLKAGTAFYVSKLASDLSTVRIARYRVYYIPTTSAIENNVNDINNNVGFWAPQSDFRIVERISSGFDSFPDLELENIYEDQVELFVDYQTRVALRAINQNPQADLVLLYIEQPDGSEHQFLLTDSRQATTFTNANSIGNGQNSAKVARYQSYVKQAYRLADNAVQKIIETVGKDSQGVPNSNIIVVSDHGFSPFHTAVNINNYLSSKGFSTSKVRAYTSGPAVNVYINLQGRESGGTVSRSEFVTLQQQIVSALQELVDDNPNYAPQGSQKVFDKIYARPLPDNLNDSTFGLGTSEFVGQDTGDVFAIMNTGYNFDGTQSPTVTRLGDSDNSVFSVPNFYGAHGYDPEISQLSAIFYAAGPDISRRGSVGTIHNIDITPTINSILGVSSASTVQGQAINLKG